MQTKISKSFSGKTFRLTLIVLYAFCTNEINSQDYHVKSTSAQKPDSILSETWLEAESEWIKESKTIFIYDSIQNTKSGVSSRWDIISSRWVFTARTDTYYNRNGKDSIEITSNWFNPAKKWNEAFQTRYSFDNHGNNTLIVNQRFDDEIKEWIDSDKKELTYDESGNDTLDIHFTWAAQTAWTASYKTKYIYDANGNNILSYLYSWDQTNFNKWLLYSKVEQTFNLNGNKILSMPYNWDPSSSQWLHPDSKYESVFDGSGNLTLDSLCLWNPGSQNSGQWMGISKNKYTNNDEGAVTLILTYTSDGISPWLALYRGTYFYPVRHVTLVPEIADHKIIFYPNPSGEFITFNLPDSSVSTIVEIWDTEGRKLLEQILPEDHIVNISDLAKGMYICRIKHEGKVYSTKIQKLGY